jgi:hypothetical protein
MSTNPFDDDFDPGLIPVSARMKNPFDLDDDESPISRAVRSEIGRQASDLFYANLQDSSRSDSMDAAMKAVFDGIDVCDSAHPLIIHTTTPSAKGSGIARSKTAVHGNNLSPGWAPVRSASAKAVLNRRRSSRFYMREGPGNPALIIPPDTNPEDLPDKPVTRVTAQQYEGLLFRPISTKSLSARCGAIAAGDHGVAKSLSRSRSSNLVETIVRSRSRQTITGADLPRVESSMALTEEEEIIRMKEMVDLIETKFRKHVICSECEDGYFCQCEKTCEKPAKLFADRYGRVGNHCYIRPGFYDPQHLVDLFIDAYDEERRLKEEEAVNIANRGYAH